MNTLTPLPSSVAHPPDFDRVLVSTFLNSIPDRIFFKNAECRFIAVSKSCVQNFGGATAEQIIGRTDFDFFSATYARRAYEDEQRILRTGQPILNKVERETWPDGRVTWSLTSKLPLRDEAGRLIGTFGISKDITKTREVELALEKVQQNLVDASRVAGMAEVANGVLHNVGTILNSLNVSASVIAEGVRRSKAKTLAKLAAMLESHRADLAAFLTTDPKGHRIPELITSLARDAIEHRDRLLREVRELQEKIDQIKEIVALQQAYATRVSIVEALDARDLMEHGLRMETGALPWRDIQLERDYVNVPPILGEKAKIIQIVVNLIREARGACAEVESRAKRIIVRIRSSTTPERVCLEVQHNGAGISPENLTRIFGHGFSSDGHRPTLALHSAANAARAMKGSLGARSDGPGLGATFVLELPAAERVTEAA